MKNNLWEKRRIIENKKDNIRDLINGALNRISVTDDESERDRLMVHIESYVKKYKKLSIESNKIFKQFY